MKKILIVSLLALGISRASLPSEYEINHFCFHSSVGEEYAAIRTFVHNKKRLQLVVNTQTLQTHIQPTIKFPIDTCAENSRYQILLNSSKLAPYPLQNDGIISASTGMFITTDLCPSSKPSFEKGLYEELIRSFTNPTPVTLFITGKWIEKHQNSLSQFIQWGKENKLSIIWGNHTYSHPYHFKVPLAENFALSKEYDLKSDTLKLEKLLIGNGLTPSVFFRFPGLVSDVNTTHTIYNLGLIAIGSDTWIAKGEKPKQGSIILLHGNKNEPKGIKMFLPMLHDGNISTPRPLTDLN